MDRDPKNFQKGPVDPTRTRKMDPDPKNGPGLEKIDRVPKIFTLKVSGVSGIHGCRAIFSGPDPFFRIRVRFSGPGPFFGSGSIFSGPGRVHWSFLKICRIPDHFFGSGSGPRVLFRIFSDPVFLHF